MSSPVAVQAVPRPQSHPPIAKDKDLAMKNRRLVHVVAVTAGIALVLSACSTGQNSSGGTTSSSPAPASTSAPASSAAMSSDMSSAASSAGGSSTAAGAVPEAILNAGGTTALPGPFPEGIGAEYGPVCKGSDLGIGKIDFATDTIGWAQSEKEANPFRVASTKSQVDEAKKRGVQPADDERPVRRAAGKHRHQGHDRQGRQGDHLLADQLHRSG